MTHEEAVEKAQQMDQSEDWYVNKSVYPYRGGLLESYTVLVNGVFAHGSVSFESCFQEIEKKLSKPPACGCTDCSVGYAKPAGCQDRTLCDKGYHA